MGSTNLNLNSNQDWSNLTGLDLPPPGVPSDAEIQQLGQLVDQASKDGITKFQGEALKAYIALEASNPQLPACDKEVLLGFMQKISLAESVTQNGGTPPPTTAKAYSDWMAVSATCNLFMTTNEIAMMIAKMSREEAKLKLAMGMVLLAMAKESMNLTIQAGQARSQQYMLEAQKCMIEMGVALASIGVTAMTTFATAAKQAHYEAQMKAEGSVNKETGELTTKQKLKAYESASRSTQPMQEVLQQTMSAIKNGIEATINLQKAQLEMNSSVAEGVKSLVDKMYQLINETYQAISDDMNKNSQIISKLFDLLKSALDTRAQIWRA